MRYMLFSDEVSRYPVALLTRVLNQQNLKDHVKGIEADTVAYALALTPKAKNAEIKAYLDELLPVLCGLQTEYLMVTDAATFKVLTKSTRVDRIGGYVLPCTLEGFDHFWVIYVPDPRSAMMDPKLNEKVTQGLEALQNHRAGIYQPPGITIVQQAHYPTEPAEILQWLRKIADQDLAADIEAFSLKHYDAGIGTIRFAWNQHEGLAFPVDLHPDPQARILIRRYLKEFFAYRASRRRTKTLWHNGAYDCYVLTYQLYMSGLLDTEGLLEGLDVLMTGFEDTQLISYLATNSCAGNKLSLKDQAQEFLGNYAVEVKDIRALPLNKLLEYNLYDALGTWYVYNKRWLQVVADNQVGVYRDYFLPFTMDIIQMQLTGLPVDMEEVKRGKAEMELLQTVAMNGLRASLPVRQLEERLKHEYVEKKNSEWKKKRITFDEVGDVDEVRFNPNSPPKLQKLLYEIMELPVLAYTDTKQPSTDGDTLEALIHHTQNPDHKNFLQHLIDYKVVNTVLTTFIPAFEAAPLAEDGWHYLFGFFKLGGTQSGRLSSSDPNLQNLPAGGEGEKTLKGRLGKAIKKMVKAPKGWLFTGLDFASLEDRISALTTKDPNKLAVYLDGFDGHSLRAYFYFRDKMPDILQVDPESEVIVANVGDTDICIQADDEVEFNGRIYTPQEFYEAMSSCGV